MWNQILLQGRGNGKEEANGEEAQDGKQDTDSCAFSTWFWSLFHNMVVIVSPTMTIIKDSAKPINQSKFDKTLSSFINICISNYI